MLRLLLPLCCALLATSCALPDSPPSSTPPEAQAGSATHVEAHVRFLADDLLEGREAGTRGYDIAALYVSSQFAQIGLQPAGDAGGWLQKVPLLQGVRRRGGELSVLGGEAPLSYVFQDEFLPAVNFDQPLWSLEAPLVFVGQAVVAPEYGHDDLAGLELEGTVAVLFSGAPARFGNDQRAFYSSGREKLRVLAERGVVGVIYLGDPVREAKSPWIRGAANWERPSMRLRDAKGAPRDTFPTIRGSASLSVEGARRLFAAAGIDAEQVFAQLKDGTLESTKLPLSVRMRGAADLIALDSHNVVGRIAGAGPVVDAEHVVYTAHLDHVGIGAPVQGDAIYNGALDNALGVGILIETARLAAQAPRAARSQLFVAVTGEEKGLLGAEHFADSPGLSGRLVANINMDMPVILAPQEDVIPIGIEHSSLKAVVEAAAADLGIALTPDPFPEEVVFVRSDQFAFVRRGIPAVYLDGGIHASVPEVDGREQLDGFLRHHYHQPSDDLNLSIHFPTAARLATLNARIGQRVGNAAKAPSWNEGNFFGGKFASER